MYIHHYFEEWPTEECGGYYVAAFRTPTYENANDIRVWCWETFGQQGFKPDTHEVRWKDGITFGEIRFSRKQDIEWFLLKWE